MGVLYGVRILVVMVVLFGVFLSMIERVLEIVLFLLLDMG